jgi:hypothetical protein
MTSRGHPSFVAAGYYVGIVLLVAGLVVAFALLTRVIRPAGTQLEVGAALATACEPGDRAPGCFAFQVANRSTETLSTECVVIPSQGTDARFVTDEVRAVLTMQTGEERILQVKVNPLAGDVVAAPRLECTRL